MYVLSAGLAIFQLCGGTVLLTPSTADHRPLMINAAEFLLFLFAFFLQFADRSSPVLAAADPQQPHSCGSTASRCSWLWLLLQAESRLGFWHWIWLFNIWVNGKLLPLKSASSVLWRNYNTSRFTFVRRKFCSRTWTWWKRQLRRNQSAKRKIWKKLQGDSTEPGPTSTRLSLQTQTAVMSSTLGRSAAAWRCNVITAHVMSGFYPIWTTCL